tara:strand:- start:297 stop:689 length:393 start_codon:yes stop_codon:yes gene_type:complete
MQKDSNDSASSTFTKADKVTKETLWEKIKDYSALVVIFLLIGPFLIIWGLGFFLGAAVVEGMPDWFGLWFVIDLAVLSWLLVFSSLIESIKFFSKGELSKTYTSDRIMAPLFWFAVACLFSWVLLKNLNI